MTSERLPRDQFPGYLGIESVSFQDGRVTAELPLRGELFAPNGFVHAAAVVGLADTLCGYGCLASYRRGRRDLPPSS
ncbi:hypothetical protein DSM43276_00806 [Mycobacteroides salmoniphilum]|nr:hypothetical protein DSM43276_00806 [Mycobacteroides salmoniphilum]